MTDFLAAQRFIFSKCSYGFLFAISVILGVALLYITCVSTTFGLALPGGPIFSLIVTVVVALLGGALFKLMNIPPMLGMLLAGLALSNIPVIKEATHLDSHISGGLKTVALVVILLKGGLHIDIMDIKRVGWAVIRLAVLPCFVEAGIAAVVVVYLLDFPWIWALMLGFVIAAVTPAILIPCLLELGNRGFSLHDNNISTLLISASSFDDVIAISAFMICLSSAFYSEKSIAMKLLHGPLEILIGVVIGIVCGMMLWVLPPTNGTDKKGKPKANSRMQCLLLLLCAVSSVFGMNYFHYSGAGPLSVIIMSLTARKGWTEHAFASKAFDELWFIAEPLLFGLVSRDIHLQHITAELLWKSMVVFSVALIFRCLTAFFSVFWTNLNMKERFFVSLSWIPRATVQAAIGSYALALAEEKGLDDTIIGYCEEIVTVAVITILISAPLGSLLMYFTAPCLLSKVATDEAEDAKYNLVGDEDLEQNAEKKEKATDLEEVSENKLDETRIITSAGFVAKLELLKLKLFHY